MKKSTKWNNITISYTEQGSGPPVVFLHGFTESSEIWNSYSESLSKSFRVICIDLPGHGESGNVGEMNTMNDMAESVRAVVGEKEKCVVIGHSMGGYVTLAFAEKFPQQVKGICLFHSSALPDSEQKKADRLRTVEIVKQDKKKYITSLIPNLFAKHNREKLKPEIDTMIRIGDDTKPEGVTGALLGMRDRPDRTEILKNAAFPVLFLPGKSDELIPLDVVLQQSMFPSKSITAILQNSGHMGFIEDREEALDHILRFCNLCYGR